MVHDGTIEGAKNPCVEREPKSRCWVEKEGEVEEDGDKVEEKKRFGGNKEAGTCAINHGNLREIGESVSS